MLSVLDQIAQGRLVCPVTHQRLRVEGESLISETGEVYPYVDGVPRLVVGRERQDEYAREAGGRMVAEYRGRSRRGRLLGHVDRVLARERDFRSVPSVQAFERVASRGSGGGLCLSGK